MTLDEAHGNYYEIRNILARVFVRANGDDDGKTIRILDAAVRDVALAAAREARDTGLPHTQAEIKRQFGLPEGSVDSTRRL